MPPRSRRRLVLTGVVAIAIAGAGVVGWVSRAAPARPPSPCEDAEQELAGVWDAGRSQAVRQALVASGKPWAEQTASLVTTELDRYAHAWAAMHRETCEATHVRHEQSEALLDLRMQCLRGRAQELRALTGLLAQPSDTLLTAAPKAVYALTPLQGCADARALTSPVPLPTDPATRSEVELVRDAMADVHAKMGLARYQEASAEADLLMPRARALRYAPLEAEVMEARGDALEYLDELPPAVDAYHEALWAAERGGDRTRAASALIDLVWAVGCDQGEHARAHEYAAHAAAMLQGFGGNPLLEADLASHEGVVLRNEGRPEEAVRRTREAVDKRAAALGTSHPRYAMALNNLAACLADQGRYTEDLEAMREAVSINARTLGEHHPDYALSLGSLAAAVGLSGRFAEARTIARQALQITEDVFGREHTRVAGVEWTLALQEMKLGALADAEGHVRHALSVTESKYGPDHPLAAAYRAILGEVLGKEGRYAEALPILRQAIASEQAAHLDLDLADTRARLGLVLVGAGKASEAVTVLEPALRMLETAGGNARQVAHARLALSRALWATGADRSRARTLAGLAVDALAADPGTSDELGDAKAWLDGMGGAAPRP
jgi:tetratricopeptide (TPR) repeat protein